MTDTHYGMRTDEIMVKEKKCQQVVFVNGVAESCQCKLRFSDGHGQYSDVHYIDLCDQHSGALFLGALMAELDRAIDPADEDANITIRSAIAMIEQHSRACHRRENNE